MGAHSAVLRLFLSQDMEDSIVSGYLSSLSVSSIPTLLTDSNVY